MLEEKLGRLKSFGSSCPRVCLITRGPAKPTPLRLGENRIAQHCEARAHPAGCRIGKDRDVGDAALGSCDRTAETFAICIRESTPSCMRAPPDAATITSGYFRSSDGRRGG